jgi:hypothetical protein
MRPIHLLPMLAPALALAAVMAPPLPSNGVGDPLPPATLEEFTKTSAKSLDDYVGRALFIEFFAYW